MKNLTNYIGLWSALILLSISFVACKKTDVPEEFNPKRMFSPTGDVKAEMGEIQVLLTWKEALHSKEKATYTVDISKDTLFAGEPLFSLQTDTTGILLTDEQLQVREKYFARVRTNAVGNTPASNWIYSDSFQISGEQLFLPIDQQVDLKDVSVLLKWRIDPTLTHIHIAKVGGDSKDVQLSAEELETGEKTIGELTSETEYIATLFAGSKNKGTTSFTTKVPSIFTLVVTPQDNVLEFIENAKDQDVIGFEAGTYDLSDAEVTIMTKNITLASVSGNPNDTKILSKGFRLRGNGAGMTLQDLTVDAQKVAETYLFDLRGETSDGGAAVFSSITIKGSIIQNWGRAFMRGSRASNRDHKIDFIRIENSLLQDNDTDYAMFEIQKLAINRFEMINSTINRVSNNIIRYDTNLGAPAAEILFDHVTINAFGNNGRRPLVDINTPANVVFKNSIIANSTWASAVYKAPTVNAELLRGGNGATVRIENSNLYNLTNGATPAVELKIPDNVVLLQNLAEPLSWTYSTNELTLPANSPLLNASDSGGPIGDPRWTLVP